MNKIFGILLAFVMSGVMAEDIIEFKVPLPINDGEVMEADITISRKGEKTIYEYHVNGRIYKIKIIPDIGPAYYFIDLDGDGKMEEVNASDLDMDLKVNQWLIFNW